MVTFVSLCIVVDAIFPGSKLSTEIELKVRKFPFIESSSSFLRTSIENVCYLGGDRFPDLHCLPPSILETFTETTERVDLVRIHL